MQHVVQIAECNQLCYVDQIHANFAKNAGESARIFENYKTRQAHETFMLHMLQLCSTS
jgi:hypothetical protein